ncbi:MAG TPA: bifunctional phosphopantothenoylcysteine decarboxylase/phosphopantothenate--cysteine ligase CoaBC [Fibrobacteraceae bacterium]|nr:bifunctional phosphopantothenoylcysteine decarboxylase/phosphopantothenate--cysteine ligase CoaBC [Fibrobacteraceae bacterium]
MPKLTGKKILLGVTGGIAAYKACELVRRLQDEGSSVRVVMTPSATQFVGPMTFAALSGFPVFQAGPHDSHTFRHIDYPRWADLCVVAPASAHSLARFASGAADEPVSQCILASLAPKLVVPAMNFAMFQAPATQRNLQTLRADGFHILEPDSGRLACGEEGQGRFPEVSRIVETITKILIPKENGRTVLITAGRTEEPIDPVRLITNRSSGKTGVALARAFRQAGFRVILVHGPMDAAIPEDCEPVSVHTALEMHQAVLERQSQSDALIFCAAVADYRPRQVATEKIKDSRSQLTLNLEPNPNILRDAVAHRRAGQVLVGFALETAEPLKHGLAKLEKSGADLLVLNTPVRDDSGFGHDKVEFSLLEPNQTFESAPKPSLGEKDTLAAAVVSRVCHALGLETC